MNILRQCHLELHKLSGEINKIYNLQLTLGTILNFGSISSQTYNLVVHYLQPASKVNYNVIMLILNCITISLSRVISVNIACSLTTNQVRMHLDCIIKLNYYTGNLLKKILD